MMDNSVRDRLIQLISSQGLSLCDDPRRCEAFLRDYCSSKRKEIHVLVSALQEGVVPQLESSRSGLPLKMLVSRCTKQLQENYAFSEEVAQWAIESWAAALGLFASGELDARDQSPPMDSKPWSGAGSRQPRDEVESSGSAAQANAIPSGTQAQASLDATDVCEEEQLLGMIERCRASITSLLNDYRIPNPVIDNLNEMMTDVLNSPDITNKIDKINNIHSTIRILKTEYVSYGRINNLLVEIAKIGDNFCVTNDELNTINNLLGNCFLDSQANDIEKSIELIKNTYITRIERLALLNELNRLKIAHNASSNDIDDLIKQAEYIQQKNDFIVIVQNIEKYNKPIETNRLIQNIKHYKTIIYLCITIFLSLLCFIGIKQQLDLISKMEQYRDMGDLCIIKEDFHGANEYYSKVLSITQTIYLPFYKTKERRAAIQDANSMKSSEILQKGLKGYVKLDEEWVEIDKRQTIIEFKKILSAAHSSKELFSLDPTTINYAQCMRCYNDIKIMISKFSFLTRYISKTQLLLDIEYINNRYVDTMCPRVRESINSATSLFDKELYSEAISVLTISKECIKSIGVSISSLDEILTKSINARQVEEQRIARIKRLEEEAKAQAKRAEEEARNKARQAEEEAKARAIRAREEAKATRLADLNTLHHFKSETESAMNRQQWNTARQYIEDALDFIKTNPLRSDPAYAALKSKFIQYQNEIKIRTTNSAKPERVEPVPMEKPLQTKELSKYIDKSPPPRENRQRPSNSDRGTVGIEINSERVITSVVFGSPAYEAGLLAGDRILEVNTVRVSSESDVKSRLAGAPGTSLNMKVLRRMQKGEEKVVFVGITRGKSSN